MSKTLEELKQELYTIAEWINQKDAYVKEAFLAVLDLKDLCRLEGHYELLAQVETVERILRRL